MTLFYWYIRKQHYFPYLFYPQVENMSFSSDNWVNKRTAKTKMFWGHISNLGLLTNISTKKRHYDSANLRDLINYETLLPAFYSQESSHKIWNYIENYV